MQLYHLNELHEQFQEAGIAIHAITAQPGGEADIRNKLTKFGLPDLKFHVHSDPSWSMMTLEPQDGIYVPNPSHPFLLKGGAFKEPYKMVQPALAIVDQKGEVVYWGSWNKLQSGQLNPDTLPNGRREDNPDGNTHDVRWRPVPEDMLLKLTEGGNLEEIRVDNLGFPDGKDHVNVKKVLHRDPAQHRRNLQADGKKTDILPEDIPAPKPRL